ncbi:MAG: hypothetical protein O2866_00955 [archaeon]|nr:hypothetical protein [archaeon]
MISNKEKTEQEVRKNEQNKLEGTTPIVILPELDEESITFASSQRALVYMTEIMNERFYGFVKNIDNALELQYLGSRKFRCISVIDHESTLQLLAMVKYTVELLDGEVQINPFTVLIPRHIVQITDSDNSEDSVSASSNDGSSMEVA